MAPVDLMEPQLAPTLVDDASDVELEVELYEDELLIEEISIDGMCGVY